MSRTIPRTYVTAAWSKNRFEAEEARKYCQVLVNNGYLPICPVLAFSGIFDDDNCSVPSQLNDIYRCQCTQNG